MKILPSRIYIKLMPLISILLFGTSLYAEKIALLFLVRKNIFHENYWQDFIDTGRDKISVYIHSKDGVSSNSPFKKYELGDTVSTTWANSLKAEIELLKQALKDETNTKFIFASESTLPFKDIPALHARAMQTDKSIFFYEPSPHSDPDNICYEKRNLAEIPAEHRYKNSQWVVLSRKHAELMVENANNYVDIISKYEADNELYPATFLASQQLLDEIEPVDITYVNWDRGGPFCFTNLYKNDQYALAHQAIRDGYFFGRKFAEYMDLSPLDVALSYRKKEPAKGLIEKWLLG